MTGVLENMNAQIQALASEVTALKDMVIRMQGTGVISTPAAAQADPFSSFGNLASQKPAEPQVPANLTSDMIVSLITPHLDNAAIKDALGVEMRAMGINALPETKPEQYPELWTRFNAVIQKAATASSGLSSTASIV